MGWLRRLRRTFVRRTSSDIADELRFHIEARIDDLVRDGMSRDEARAAARRRFGNLTALNEQTRDFATVRWARDGIDDLRLACRLLRRHITLTVTVAATLALGIGATTAIFSVVYAVVLRPLPYEDSGRLVAVWTRPESETTGKMTVRFADFEQWRREAHTFSGLAGWAWFGGGTVLSDRGAPRSLLGVAATAQLFTVLGAHAAVGRTFYDGDLSDGCAVVLAHHLWESLGRNPRIVGTPLRLNDRPCTVVGVMPASFVFFPEPTDLWSLITPTSDIGRNPQAGVGVVGRLAPGVTTAQAASELRGLAASSETDLAPGVPRMVPIANDLQEEFTWMAGPNLRATLFVLLAAVGCLLAIACMNAANLLLGRAMLRRREVAVRTAIGCSRSRLWRQLTAEGLLLGVIAAGGGAALGAAAIRVLRAVNPVQLPPGTDLAVNAPMFAFTAIVGVLVGIIAGALPAWRVSDIAPAAALIEGGRSVPATGRQALARSLVVAQAALSIVLLAGALLLMQSVATFGTTSLGFEPDGLVSYGVIPPAAKYRDADARARVYRRLLEAFGSNAGGAVALSTGVPPRTEGAVGVIEREGSVPADPRRSVLDVAQQSISGSYFDVMRVALRRGRTFVTGDTADAPPVCIVNDALARRYFGSDDPLGRRIRFAGVETANPWLTIVGVVGNEKRTDPGREFGWLSQPLVYRPIAQRAAPAVRLVVRSRGALDAARIDALARGVESELVIGAGAPVDKTIADYFRFPQFRAGVLTVFAGIALFLVVVGLYGVLAQAVAQRTRDIGIRMALGARQATVVGDVLREGVLLASLGVGGGLLLIVPAKELISGLLYDIGITNITALAGAAATLVIAALAASYVPARRAAQVDPIAALRAE